MAFCTPKCHHLVLPGAPELAPDPLNWVSVLSAPGPLGRLPSPQGLCVCPSFRSQVISVFTFHQCAATCLYETCLMDWFPPLSANLRAEGPAPSVTVCSHPARRRARKSRSDPESWPVFVTPWTAACQAPLSFTISRSLLRFASTELVMPSSHLVPAAPFCFHL